MKRLKKEEKLEVRKSNQKNKRVEATVFHRCLERIILLAPRVKISWIIINKNHGGFKQTDFHNAARKLDDEKLDKNFFICWYFLHRPKI